MRVAAFETTCEGQILASGATRALVESSDRTSCHLAWNCEAAADVSHLLYQVCDATRPMKSAAARGLVHVSATMMYLRVNVDGPMWC